MAAGMAEWGHTAIHNTFEHLYSPLAYVHTRASLMAYLAVTILRMLDTRNQQKEGRISGGAWRNRCKLCENRSDAFRKELDGADNVPVVGRSTSGTEGTGPTSLMSRGWVQLQKEAGEPVAGAGPYGTDAGMLGRADPRSLGWKWRRQQRVRRAEGVRRVGREGEGITLMSLVVRPSVVWPSTIPRPSARQPLRRPGSQKCGDR